MATVTMRTMMNCWANLSGLASGGGGSFGSFMVCPHFERVQIDSRWTQEESQEFSERVHFFLIRGEDGGRLIARKEGG